MPPEDRVSELMQHALSLAAQAAACGEVPVAAIVYNTATGDPIAQAANRRETDHDPTAHAEIVALRDAGQRLGRWNLTGCSMVVTLEPCPMCAGALINARLDHLTYAAADPKAGCIDSLYQLAADPRFNHRLPSQSNVLAPASAALLQDFFKQRRRKTPPAPPPPADSR